MGKQVSPAGFRRKLTAWYMANRRDLPWRRTRDPYRIWLSEVMLQQTQVETVKPYYRRFLAEFPDITSLARADTDRVMKLWEGLGYYARIRNFQEAARRVARDHGGRVPNDPVTFSSLPGVGPYTTAAVQSIAFGHALPVIDGNVIRVISRLFDIGRPLTPRDPELIEIANRLMGPGRSSFDKLRMSGAERLRLIGSSTPAGDYNQSIMELGALVCRPQSPDCDTCPVHSECLARKRGTVEARPLAQRRKSRPHRTFAAALIERRIGGRCEYLVCRRKPAGLLGGLWELPTVDAGGARRGFRKRVKRQFGIDIRVGGQLAQVRHAYSHFSVTLAGYSCRLTGGTPASASHTSMRWAGGAALKRVAMPEVNRKLLREVRLSPRTALSRSSAPARSR